MIVDGRERDLLLETLSWKDVCEYLKVDERIVIVLGATEEHADLSVCTDTIIPYEIAKKSCYQEKVILAPAVPFGISTWSSEYPGTISLKTNTYVNMIGDIMDSLLTVGFRKFYILNGHGFNKSICPVLGEKIQSVRGAEVLVYQWYELPSVKLLIQEKNIKISHANWIENFRFTNIHTGKRTLSPRLTPMPNLLKDAKTIREELIEGNGPGPLEIDESIMNKLFDDLVIDFSKIIRGG